MIAAETALEGAYLIDLDLRHDTRGFFARVFCANEFAELGLEPFVAQSNVSFNFTKGTLRGLHFQWPPYAETKVIRCTRGAILDVIVDLRPESPTYLSHVAVELTADNRRSLYVPRRFAHAYQTLVDDTEVVYTTGEMYRPEAEAGLRFNDSRLNLAWPLPAGEMSTKDLSWPLLSEFETELRSRMAVSSDGDAANLAASASANVNPR